MLTHFMLGLLLCLTTLASYAQSEDVVVEETKTLKDVAAEKEVDYVSNKRIADRTTFLGFGPSFFDNMNSDKSGFLVSGGMFWNVENSVDLGLVLDFSFSTEESDIKFLNPRIEGRYMLTQRDISPYIGGGLGYGFSSAHEDGGVFSFDDSANGFSLTGSIGLKFFRTSSVNLITDIVYTKILDQNSKGSPSTTSLRVGINF